METSLRVINKGFMGHKWRTERGKAFCHYDEVCVRNKQHQQQAIAGNLQSLTLPFLGEGVAFRSCGVTNSATWTGVLPIDGVCLLTIT